VPLCPCRQRRETVAFHLCNLQTFCICSVSAEMHRSLTCSTVSPGHPCGPQKCATDSFLYLSTQLCLIGPSTQTTVQSGSPVAGSFCSICLNCPHALWLCFFFTLPVFLFSWYDLWWFSFFSTIHLETKQKQMYSFSFRGNLK